MSARVLLIEDNAANLELITYLLRAHGYDVTGAGDAMQGLKLAQSGDYALVLTDILMPKMDGYELARRLRSDAHLAGTPLIAVTALAMSGDRENILAHGFDGYISKPIEPQQFVTEIERLLKEHGDGADSRR